MKEIKATKKARGFLGEFKTFISRGNVIDMAVGVILATAFGKITTSLVNDVIMPAIEYYILIPWLGGSGMSSSLNLILRPEMVDETGAVVVPAITLGLGTFLGTIVNFLLVALVIFLVVKGMNAAKDRLEAIAAKEKAAQEAVPPAPSKEELLLTEIRDLLRQQSKS